MSARGVVRPFAPAEAYDDEAAQGEQPERARKPVRNPLDWTALQSRTPPPREWAVRQWFGMGHVTLMAGGAGTGKTSVAQAVASCLTLGADYVDEVNAQRRVLMWAAEDDEAELWRRQLAIASWLRARLADFAGRLYLESYDGKEVELAATLDQRRLISTPMYGELCEQIGDYKADVVMLDNIARVYAGNENDRHQVTTFIAMLTAAAKPTNAAVLLLGHPGKAAGSEFSGSTAWEGAVRSRLYLGRKLPDCDPGDEPAEDETTRYLCRRKANYSARDWRKLTYRDGVMVPEQVQPGVSRIGPEYARDVVARAVHKLAEMGLCGNGSTSSPNYLPKLAKEYKLLEDVSGRQFAAAMREMRKDHVLDEAEVGKYANRSPRMGLVLKEDT